MMNPKTKLLLKVLGMIAVLAFIYAMCTVAEQQTQQAQKELTTAPYYEPPIPTQPYFIVNQNAYLGTDFSVTDLRDSSFSISIGMTFDQGNIYVFENSQWHTIFTNVTFTQNGNNITLYPTNQLYEGLRDFE